MRVNVARVMNRMFTTSVEVERLSAGDFINGIWRKGSKSIINILASVQPLAERDYIGLPEGVRDREAINLFSRSALVGSASGKDADIVKYNGRDWRVVKAVNWTAHGYWQGIAIKEEVRG